jgi:hypothetical protein
MSAIHTEEVYKQIIHKLEQTIECYKEQRKADRQLFLTILDKFPPYHGLYHAYTKHEVEDWLKMARSTFEAKETTMEKEQ